MNKTKIDWCDMSWNPVTGCLHGCEYCYARKIADRFGERGMPATIGEYHGGDGTHEISQKQRTPYPFGFAPTFHHYRLGEPARKAKPQTIFVCSMADLFGEWVPGEWQQEVLKACLNAPQHRYLFLTKAPNGVCQWPRFKGDKDYIDFDIDAKNGGVVRDNIWMGVSFTGLKEDIPRIERYKAEPLWDDRAWYLNRLPVHVFGHKFLSIEPIHCDVTELCKEYVDGFSKKPFKEYWFRDFARKYEWIIAGAESGNRSGKIMPERIWIEHLASFCREVGIPLFMKESLRDLMGDDFKQEFPWEVEHD